MRVKRILYFLLALAFSLNSVTFVTGDSVKTVLSTPADLKAFTSGCITDAYSMGREFILLNDIDMEGEEFKPASLFCGRFNGNGHSIKNIKFKTEGEDIGLFLKVSEGAVVENLTVECDFTAEEAAKDSTGIDLKTVVDKISKEAGYKNEFDDDASVINGTVGAIAAVNEGKILKCTSKGNITGVKAVGGMVGTNKITGLIEDGTNEAEATGTSMVGGIVGKNLGRIRSCKNKGDISKETGEDGANIGGIAGYSDGVCENCENHGSVGCKGFGVNIGGICGKHSGSIEECLNYGAVYGSKNTAGIVGMFIPYTDSDTVTEQIKEDFRTERDKIKDDLDEFEDDLKDRLDDILDGRGLFGDLFEDEDGNPGLLAADGPLAENNTKLTNSIVDAINAASDRADKNSEELRSATDSLSRSADKISDSAASISNSIDSAVKSGNENASRIADSVDRAVDDAGNVSNKMADSVDRAVDNADNTANRMADSVDSAVDNVNDVSSRVADNIDSAVDNAKDVSNRLADNVDSATENTNTAVNKITDSAVELSESTRKDLERLNSAVTDTVYEMKDTLNESTSLIREMEDLMDDISYAVDSGAEDRNRLINEAISRLDNFNTDSLDKLLNKLTDTVERITTAIEKVKGELGDNAAALSKAIITPLEILRKSMEETVNTVKAEKEKIAAIKERLRKMLLPESNTSSSSSGSQNTAFFDPFSLFETTVYAAEKEEDNDVKTVIEEVIDGKSLEDAIRDVVNIDILLDRQIGGEKADNALVKYSCNKGSVYADKNSGGIVGFMGMESLFKEGEELVFYDGTPVSEGMEIKAVVNGCINTGTVEAKKECAGGIAGNCDMGIIKNCLDNGKESVTDSGMCGGIVGQGTADITLCIAISELSGKTDVGGIAGKGKNISLCYSLPSLVNNPERVGAIAGSADGDVLNNYYIDEGLGGISGAGYGKSAEPLAPAEMTGQGTLPPKMQGFTPEQWYMEPNDTYLPQLRYLANNDAKYIGAFLKDTSDNMAVFHFKATFVAEGREIAVVNKEYGQYLEQSEIPKLDMRNGYTPHWDRDTSKPILRNVVFTAVYDDATTTVSSEENPPVMLVEGNFSDNTRLTYTEAVIDKKFAGYKKGRAYDFTITPWNNTIGDIKVHIKAEKKYNAIGITENGKEKVLSAKRDGNYLVFSLSEPQKFILLQKPLDIGKILIPAAGSVAGALLLFIIVKLLTKKRRQLYEKEEREKEEKEKEGINFEDEEIKEEGESSPKPPEEKASENTDKEETVNLKEEEPPEEDEDLDFMM